MAEDKGKKRGANFSSGEINLLMNCLLPEIQVIECKKTDGVSIKDKQNAWKRVHLSFQAQNKDQFRDLLSLKLKYDNIKRNLKKKISENKAELTKTGGGPPNEKTLFWYEEQVYAVLQLSIDGLESQGDCDIPNLVPTSQNVSSSRVIVEGLENMRDTEKMFDLQTSDASQSATFAVEVIKDFSDFEYPQDEEPCINPNSLGSREALIDTGKSKSSNLTTKSGWNLKKRKRTVTAEERKNTLHSFEVLSEKKTDLALIQKKCFEVELQIKMEEENKKKEEWIIKKQILELELQYKEEQLAQIKDERTRQEAIHILNEQEIKLKIEILKCELNHKLQSSMIRN